MKLDISRGKPSQDIVGLSNDLLKRKIRKVSSEDGIDLRNYGSLDGLSEAKKFFSEILNLPKKNIFVGGNSSLFHMYNLVHILWNFGLGGNKAWVKEKSVKFLCPVPGYDRHFSIMEDFGIKMVNIAMQEDGPDMDKVEKLVKNDASIKGIWIVPLYSNPTGVVLSERKAKRLASLKTKAKDFRIFCDNAYGIHHIWKENKTPDMRKLCKAAETLDRLFIFFSTSKITFPGSGVATFYADDKNYDEIKKHISMQTIGFDKINQIRTIAFLRDLENTRRHMKKIADILRPKFDFAIDYLIKNLMNKGLLDISIPKGGYFISVDLKNASAKKVIALAKKEGLILTPAGSTYPYMNDSFDKNIRIAPSYPSLTELKGAVKLFTNIVLKESK
ncbi:MAG: aminotransferase class I/II-fold pyridoxal phosphate-dependent enzyme [Clostridiales Family XIII bacterium]|jgi:DNA-binding transcriptional MocR family regulator|nr:aminotransferase class I/II-fold pyridoxal phosphate-dependent enzyme [Clostridiales Family XIII bacterium]